MKWRLILMCLLAGDAFASSLGPFPGANGIPGGIGTCEAGGCHISSAPDLAQGRVRIDGLPAQWSPNTTYVLTVVVQRPTATRFGFQLAAINTANGKQAGTFTTSDPIIAIIPDFASGIRYAEHIDAPYGTASHSFVVSWRSPATSASGDVDFYVAGNAANGNMDRTGDAIYLSTAHVPPQVTLLSNRSYAVAGNAASSLKTTGEAAASQSGYARLITESGSALPAGIVIFGLRKNNVLVSETSVPASAPITAGRIYAEISDDAAINTGIAIANPNAQTATIRFATGDQVMTIPAGGQIAKFLTDAPFNIAKGFQGAFSFTSDVPVSVIASRGFTNERSDFLMTTLPVIDTNAAAPVGVQVVPQFADGGGWRTHVVLVNPSDTPISGSIVFLVPGMDPVAYAIPARGAFKLSTSGSGDTTRSGSIRVVPTQGSPAAAAFAIYSNRPPSGAVTVSEAGAGAISGKSFQMYVESGNGVQTGLALASPSDAATNVVLQLSTGASTTVTIPAAGQISTFIDQLFPGLPSSFQGLVRITSAVDISVVGLRARTNERTEFLITTTAAVVDGFPTAGTTFPHLVDGGGYTTQFILMNTGSAPLTGTLTFVKPDGTGLTLTFAP